MAKKSRRRRQKPSSTSHRSPWLWAAIGGALLLIIGGVWLAWPVNQADPNNVSPAGVDPNFAPEVTGAPRLAVEQITIDEGNVKVNTPIRTAFRLQNVGDQPLKILGEPAVELVEGC
jgi:hypothetical protein